MSSPVTILYYTSNREPEKFEAKIIQRMLETNANQHPIVSVSQKPLPDLGTNICIGHHDAHNINRLQQTWIGLHYCTTPYVTVAEADFIYPPEYFAFIPEREDDFELYNYRPVYILYMWKGRQTLGTFWHKDMSEGARTSSVQAHFNYVEFSLRSADVTRDIRDWPIIREWLATNPNPPRQLKSNDESDFHARGLTGYDMRAMRRFVANYFKFVDGELSAINLRTKFGMSNPYKRRTTPFKTLPHWGSSDELRRELANGVPEFANFRI